MIDTDMIDDTPPARKPQTEEDIRRSRETLRWLSEHCDYQPFGADW